MKVVISNLILTVLIAWLCCNQQARCELESGKQEITTKAQEYKIFCYYVSKIFLKRQVFSFKECE